MSQFIVRALAAYWIAGIPWFVARWRGHPSRHAILVITILLAVVVSGMSVARMWWYLHFPNVARDEVLIAVWAGALVWAFTGPRTVIPWFPDDDEDEAPPKPEKAPEA